MTFDVLLRIRRLTAAAEDQDPVSKSKSSSSLGPFRPTDYEEGVFDRSRCQNSVWKRLILYEFRQADRARLVSSFERRVLRVHLGCSSIDRQFRRTGIGHSTGCTEKQQHRTEVVCRSEGNAREAYCPSPLQLDFEPAHRQFPSGERF